MKQISNNRGSIFLYNLINYFSTQSVIYRIIYFFKRRVHVHGNHCLDRTPYFDLATASELRIKLIHPIQNQSFSFNLETRWNSFGARSAGQI